MNQDIKRRLVERLRKASGDMPLAGQDRPIGYLCRRDKFCVMGHLCDLFAEEYPGRASWVEDETGHELSGARGFQIDNEYPEFNDAPLDVLAWADMHTSVFFDGDFVALVTLNDHYPLTLAQIADLIEAQL